LARIGNGAAVELISSGHGRSFVDRDTVASRTISAYDHLINDAS